MRNLVLVAVFAFSSFALGPGAFAQSDETLSPDEILKSIETGEAAQNSGLPYGFALPEQAKVLLSMLSGLAIQIEFEGSRRDLDNHFRAELDRLGFNTEARDRKDGKTSFVATHPSLVEGELIIQFSKARRKNNWQLLFINLTPKSP